MPLSAGSLVAYLSLNSAEFESGIRRSREQMAAAGGSAERLGVSVTQAENALRGAGQQAAVGAAGTAKFRQAQLQALAAAERYTKVLSDESATLAQVARAEAGLIAANERLKMSAPTAAVVRSNAEVAKTPGLLARTAGGIASTAKSMVGLGAAFGAFELIKKAVDSGKNLTTALNSVQAVSRATDSEMVKVRATVIGLGKDLTIPGATAIDAATALNDLVKAGISLPRALQATRPALLLASATQTDMADTAKALGDSMDIWSIKGQNAGHAAKILGAATLGASHDLMGLFDAIKQAGPTAQALNINLDDTATALVYLSKHGLSTSVGGAGLKVMLTSLAKDTPKGVAALKDLGVTAFTAQGKFVGLPKLFDQLHTAQGRFGVDKERFLRDMNAAFGSRSQSVTALFAKATGKDFDELKKHLEAGDLQKFADQMNRGVSASFRQLHKQVTASMIDVYQGAEPVLTGLLQMISKALPAGIDIAKAALAPFVSAWHALGAVLGPVSGWVGDVASHLSFLAPVLKGVGGAALAMFVAFKGLQAVRAASFAVLDAGASMGAGMRNAAASTKVALSSMQSDSAVTAAAMQADLLSIGVAASEEAAAVDRAAADTAAAQLAAAETIGTASDAEIASLAAVAAAAETAATASAESAATIAAAAETASAEVVASGDAAKIGWTGLAGPLGIAAIGVLTLVSMFHKSTTASKEATDSAKAYTDVLSKGGAKSDLVDAITKQLKDNNLPQMLARLNTALGKTAFTGKQFTDAIQSQGSPLATLKTRLEAVVKAGTYNKAQGRGFVQELTPAAKAASKALKDLTDQSIGLSKATKKDLLDTKTFAGVSASIDKVSARTKVASQTAATYAEMLGIQVDKNGVAAVSGATLAHAVNTVSGAYGNASSTGSDFLAALSTFSKSAGTAADRAALIGATLKAANGDALSFASSMNAGAVATHQLDTDMASAAKSVGKSGVSVGTFIASIVNLKKGTIDYSNSAAAPLINDLQSMQTAAMNAASATYQHEKAMKGGKRAADDAYTTYQRLTSGALVAQARQLGLTKGQADKLAKSYFGMPKNVKTAIEQTGANPIVNVLNKIGQQLSFLTHQPWNPAVGLKDKASAPLTGIDRKIRGVVDRSNVVTVDANVSLAITQMQRVQNAIDKLTGGHIDIGVSGRGTAGMATGGIVRGPGTGTSDTAGVFALSRGEAIIPAKAVSQHPDLVRRLIKAGRGMASGGVVGSLASMLAAMGLSKAGIAGVLGNAQIESGLRLGAYNARENAHGLFQWEGGRWTALQALAKRMHVGATSKTAEFAMLQRELKSMPGLMHTLRSTGSAKNAAAAFDQIFERSSGSSRGARESAAQSFMRQLQSGHLTGKAGNPLTQATGTSGVISAANALGKLIAGGRDHTKGILASSVVGDMLKLESALAKAGAPSGMIAKLTRENKALAHAASQRNHAASMLNSARRAVAAAVATRTQDAAAFKAAGVGSFDITSAGQDANGRVTSGSLRSAQQQDVTRVRKWAKDAKRLIGLKIFPADYLRELLGKGPDALQTIDAILGMSGSDLKAFAANEKTIDSLSGSVASAGAAKLDDPAIVAAQKAAAYWDKQVARYEHAMSTVVERGLRDVAAEVSRLNVSSKLQYKAGDLYIAVKTDESKSKHRKPTK